MNKLIVELRWLDFVTWIIVIMGWVVFHRLALRRDQKNRYLSKIDNITKRVEDVEEAALQFWSSPGHSRDRQERQRRSMIMMLNHLETVISHLQKPAPMFGNIAVRFDSEVNDLSRSILDGNGEACDRSTLAPDDPRWKRISNAIKKMQTKLHSIE
ncbi:MAG: hypothetical protein OXE94_11495 [Aestuariivita sp.]|nr:hypothetical protein [Aestuariivita sp.]MCY4201906.1 hypothetical protein [Aestuariivita sp.]